MSTKSPFFQLSVPQTGTLLKVARVGKRDVFYDLGCAKGLVVRKAVAEAHAKRAIGVEVDRKLYERARLNAIDNLTKAQLRRVDYWYNNYQSLDLDFNDATVVYNSLEEAEDEIAFYRERFKVGKIRVAKKDLPFVGYSPSRISRESSSCWFFVMKFPLQKVKTEDQWASLVLGKPSTMKDVYRYYVDQLRRRNIANPYPAMKNLKRLLRKRFGRKRQRR